MTTLGTIGTLRAVQEALKDPDNWVQGSWAHASGGDMSTLSEAVRRADLTCACVSTHLEIAAARVSGATVWDGMRARSLVLAAAAQVHDEKSWTFDIPDWNDNPSTSIDEVRGVLVTATRRAIAEFLRSGDEHSIRNALHQGELAGQAISHQLQTNRKKKANEQHPTS